MLSMIILAPYKGASQEINIITGLGSPELLNAGIKIQSEQFQFGLSAGMLGINANDGVRAVTGDFYFHFGGYSDLTDLPPWYMRLGATYLKDEWEYEIDKYIYLNTKIGRDFNFTETFGAQFDLGLSFQLDHNEIQKKPHNGWNFDFEFPVLPAFGLEFFWRIE